MSDGDGRAGGGRGLNVRALGIEDLALFLQIAVWLNEHSPRTFRQLAELLAAGAGQAGSARFRAMRRLERIEEQARGGELVNRDRGGLRSLTPAGLELLAVARKVIGDVESYEYSVKDAGAGRPLRVAASEAVMTYLFPHILLPKEDEDSGLDWLRLEQFQSDSVRKDNGRMAEGKIQLAIAWDAHPPGCSELIDQRPLADSDAPLHFVFHPLHPFAHWLRANSRPFTPDFEERLLAEVKERHLVVYPNRLPRLKSLAEGLAGGADKCLRVEGFPDVVSHVRMRIGVGLFPGWEWLRKQIRRETYVLSVPVPRPAGGAVPSISLLYYRPKDSKRARAVDAFLTRVERKLAELNTRSRGEDAWRFVNWASPFRDAGQLGKTWRAHFVTTGDRAVPIPAPHWRVGTCTFRAAGGGRPRAGGARREHEPLARYRGRFLLSSMSGSGHPHAFDLDLSEFRDSLTATSHPAGPDRRNYRTAFLSFSRRIAKDTQGGACLLGFIHFDYAGDKPPAEAPIFGDGVDWCRPTSAPFLLCPEGVALEPKDYREIGDLLTFLGETDGIAYPAGDGR